MALCPSRLYTKYSKQTKEEVGGDFRGGGKLTVTQLEPYTHFSDYPISSSHILLYLAVPIFTTNSPPPGAGPPTTHPPTPCKYLFFSTTDICSVALYRGLGRGGGEGDHTPARGRTYIRATGGRPYIY